MKKILLVISSILLGVGVMVLISKNSSSQENVKPYTMINYTFSGDYKSAWQKVDSLEQQGLTRSALEMVQKIYQLAKDEGHQPQLIKSILYQLKYANNTEENSEAKIINDLNEEIEKAEFPASAILQSILATSYWQYYQNNRWRIQQRTETINFANDDFETWDLKQFVRVILKNYQSSLENAEGLKKSSIKDFEDILIYADHADAMLRPTLYDLLAHQALEFYVNDESSLTDPVYKFELKRANDFFASKDFVKINYETKDSLSLKFHAIKLYQKLIAFHLKDQEKEALIDVDLLRLLFVNQNSVNTTKSKLYLSALERMEQHYAKTPYSSLVTFYMAQYHYNNGITYNSQASDENKWELQHALELCNQAITRYPGTFGSEKCLRLRNDILHKSLTFQTENANLPNEPFRSLLTYKNVDKVFIRIIRLNDSLEEKEKDLYSQELIDLYRAQKAEKEWAVNLPDDNDYQNHSVEIAMPPLPFGKYVVVLATDKSFKGEGNAVAYSKTWVTNISFISKEKGTKSIRIVALNRKTGHPVPNSQIVISVQKYDTKKRSYVLEELERGKTDSEGGFEFEKTSNRYGSSKISLTHGDDYFESESYINRNHQNDQSIKRVTQFYLDRAIYRPGQVVYFKGINYESDGKKDSKILTNYHTQVVIKDANYQEIDKMDMISNEYGTFSGKFTLPEGVIGGSFHIANEIGSKLFKVEEYKRPKFEVHFEPVTGSFALNDRIKVSGNAKTYSGANLNDVVVKYRVVRSAYFPYFDYRWGYYGSYGRMNSEMEISNGVVKTDAAGHFEVDFAAIPDLSIPKETKPVFTYAVVADVVDVTGETHSASTYVSAGYVALVASINLPEIVNSQSLEKHSIRTTNLNSQFEAANISVEVHQLKAPDRVFRKRMWTKPDKFLLTKDEFYKKFSHDVYDKEDQFQTWAKEKKVFGVSMVTTDSSSIQFKNQKEWLPGTYALTLKTEDKNGTPIELTKYFILLNPDSKKVPTRDASWVYFDTKSYEPGDTATLIIGSAETDTKALYELEHDGKVIKKEWVLLNDEQKKLEIPIKESYRGNVYAHVTMVKNNASYITTKSLTVPWTNKQLNITFETFRDKIRPGADEEWKLKIAGPKGDAVAAELLTSMYDESLDAFASNDWSFWVYPYSYSRWNWSAQNSFEINRAILFENDWNTYVSDANHAYPAFNNFGFYLRGNYNRFGTTLYGSISESEPGEYLTVREDAYDEPAIVADGIAAPEMAQKEQQSPIGESSNDKTIANKPSDSFEGVSIRNNLNETAFFFPDLRTDENGEVVISFTAPEALTRWKFMALAHTKDLKSAVAYNQTVTQKELMISPNPPRFLREGDEIYFTAKVSNLSDHSMEGVATLQLFDAFTMKPVDDLFENNERVVSFKAAKGMSEGLSWRLKIPIGKVDAIVYRVIAKAGDFSDGEENVLPVLVNRMLVTETLPLPVKGNETRTFVLDKLMNNASTTLQNYNLTLEFTSNPAWYAIQALPYMMEYPYECSEQIFSRFYANSIATHIANSNPKIKKVFESWKTVDKEALLSNLEKNQELKSALLEETPWVLDAQNETERKNRVGLLFDLTKMATELDLAEQQLQQNQYDNGGWPWFTGLPESRYITQHIVIGFGHLERLGIKDIRQRQATWEMLQKAVRYTDQRMYEDYAYLKKNAIDLNKNNIGYNQIQYLYGRSYYLDVSVDKKYSEAYNYWKGQAKKYWLSNNKYMQGMIALSLYRMNDAPSANKIIKSILENAVFNDEMGMYFKEEWGWHWYQAPIETQALLIEAVEEISKDQSSVDLMKVWLLKQKQVQDWKTTKATAEACYALLLRGSDWLADTKLPKITVGKTALQLENNPKIHIEEGTGYFKTAWKGDEIESQMAEVTVTNRNDVVAWGSMYWQYFEQLDKITSAESPLKIKKQLFLELDSETGKKISPVDDNTSLKPGDKIIVRIEIRVDRDMEFVHLKDMRASGLEPINVLSRHKYQDGLWYYENTRDMATNFFMDWLPKGTYVFEYPLRVNHRGDFSNGITTIQSMYAPEFSSHSEGVRVEVK